jgi:hypothetical protein
MTKARDLADRTSADLTAVTAGTGISVTNGTGPIPTVTNTVATGFDAKGDLIVGTGADTFSKLTVATTNNYVLTSASSEATGLKWAAAAESSANWTLLNSGGTAFSGAGTTLTVNVTSYDKYLILINGAGSIGGNEYLRVRFNGDTASNYITAGVSFIPQTTYSPDLTISADYEDNTGAVIGRASSDAASEIYGSMFIIGGKSTTGVKVFSHSAIGTRLTGADQRGKSGWGIWENTTNAITSISFHSSNNNWDEGTVFIYGSN